MLMLCLAYYSTDTKNHHTFAEDIFAGNWITWRRHGMIPCSTLCISALFIRVKTGGHAETPGVKGFPQFLIISSWGRIVEPGAVSG